MSWRLRGGALAHPILVPFATLVDSIYLYLCFFSYLLIDKEYR